MPHNLRDDGRVSSAYAHYPGKNATQVSREPE